MIVRRLGGDWVLIEQNEHGRHAGAIAEAWSSGPFGPVPGSLVTAARLHDIGWIEWDREPTLDPATGGPANFPAVRDDRHSGFYARGIRRVAQQDPYAGYLVSLHASGIYGGRYGWRGLEPVAWDAIGVAGRRFLTEQRSYRAELAAGPLASESALLEFDATWRCYMLLQAFDYLSLLCCLGFEPGACGPVPRGLTWGHLEIRRTSPWGVALDPFPFLGDALELEVASRSLAGGRLSGDEELRRALSAAPVERRITRYERLGAGP